MRLTRVYRLTLFRYDDASGSQSSRWLGFLGEAWMQHPTTHRKAPFWCQSLPWIMMDKPRKVVFQKKPFFKDRMERGRAVWQWWWNLSKQKQQWKGMVWGSGMNLWWKKGLKTCVLWHTVTGHESDEDKNNTNLKSSCLQMNTCLVPGTILNIPCDISFNSVSDRTGYVPAVVEPVFNHGGWFQNFLPYPEQFQPMSASHSLHEPWL